MSSPAPRLIIFLLTLLIAGLLLLGYLHDAQAHEIFNIHALEIGDPGQPVVDLSAFSESDGQLPGTYRVTVYVNGEKQGDAQDIRFVTGTDKKLCAQITPSMLKSWGVKAEAFPALSLLPQDSLLTDIGRYIPMAFARLNFSQLQLDVSIPQAAMNTGARGYVPPSEWDEGVPAALFNYNVSGSNTRRNGGRGTDNNYYANFQGGLNAGAWRLRNYSTWNYDEKTGEHWKPANTWLQRDIQILKGQLTLGDSYTPPDIFDSVQFRGVQLASDDNMLPDSLRGFAPVIRGIAQSNARVTVKQNGYIIYQTYVAPGAFTISDLYPTSGSGDLDVVIKEADGSERTFVQPFSAVPVMQREGRLKYALTAGKYRSGNNGGDTTPVFGQMTAIYGLPYAFTVYGGSLYSADYQSGVAGVGSGLGNVGSVSADITTAHTVTGNKESRNGQSYRIQYSKNFLSTDTNFTLAAYRYSTAGFYTFRDTNELRTDSRNSWQMVYNKRRRLQVDLGQRIGNYGSLFISGYQQDYWKENGTERTLSTGWNGNINAISYGVSYSYSAYPGNTQRANRQLAFNIQVPLSHFLSGNGASHAWASYGVSTQKPGDTRQQVGLNGTLLADNNLNYSIQQSYAGHGSGNAGSISAGYKGGKGEITGGYNYGDGTQQFNYGLKGGVVVHPYGVTLSQTSGETIAVVRAPGTNGTKVQNNTGVSTDGHGYAVVPFLSPYKKNRIALDTGTLNDEVDIDSAVKSVTPTQGAVVMADFKTRVGRRVLMTLHYRSHAVPFGAQAELRDGGSGIVGDDGQVYLTGVPDEGTIAINWNGTRQCEVHYRLPEQKNQMVVMTLNQECVEVTQ